MRNSEYRKIVVCLLILVLALTLFGCESKTATEELPKSEEILQEGTYTGVLIMKELPVLEYAQKALDDPESLPTLEGEEAEACEGVDLNDEEVRKQVEEAIAKGQSTVGVEVPLTIIITAGDVEGEFTSTIKADFATAFPDYECEEATDEPYTVTHSPGKVTFQNVSDEDTMEIKSVFEGAILKDGVIQGNFTISNSSEEYVEFTGSNVMMAGTWEAKK